MTQGSLITEELRRAIGKESEPVTVEIDKTLLKRFAEGVEDPNPLWQDEGKARDGRYGGIVGPPSLLSAVLLVGNSPVESLESILPPRMLDGGADWEVFQPIRPGDSITVRTKLADVAEREGRVGPMLLLTFASSWHNQRGEVVATGNGTLIRY